MRRIRLSSNPLSPAGRNAGYPRISASRIYPRAQRSADAKQANACLACRGKGRFTIAGVPTDDQWERPCIRCSGTGKEVNARRALAPIQFCPRCRERLQVAADGLATQGRLASSCHCND